jgi:hypothetical protein
MSSRTSTKAHVCLTPKYLIAAKSNELSARLLQCFEYLRSLSQGDIESRPPGLENIASQMLEPILIKSKISQIRVLVAQCCVELLRVYAPQPPYNEKELIVG